MLPEQVSARLRQIADRIDRSDQPSLAQVAGDIRTLLTMVTDTALPGREGSPVGGRRVSPAMNESVNVADDQQFRSAIKRTASTKSYDRD